MLQGRGLVELKVAHPEMSHLRFNVFVLALAPSCPNLCLSRLSTSPTQQRLRLRWRTPWSRSATNSQ